MKRKYIYKNVEREKLKNNISIGKGYYNYKNYNFNNSNNNSYINLNNNFNNNDIDKNIKDYIDEQAQKIKEFIHEEISNLHVDLIRQFEIQNSKNMKMIQEYFYIYNTLIDSSFGYFELNLY